MSTNGRKRKVKHLTLDPNCNKQFKVASDDCFDNLKTEDLHSANCSIQATSKLCKVKGQEEEECLTSHNSEEWIKSPAQQFDASNHRAPLISQETVAWKSTKGGRTKAVTLLAKVDTNDKLEYVRVVSKMAERTKLVRGFHKCIGDEESGIGVNNVFVTVLIEREHARTIEVGDVLGYAEPVGNPLSTIFNTFFTVSFNRGVARLRFGNQYSLQMHQDETILVNVSVESLPSENRKHYPIQFESTNKNVSVIGDRYTIQKGNTTKIKIKNISGKRLNLHNADILGIAKSLNTAEFIEKIQSVKRQAVSSTGLNSLSTTLSPDLTYSFVFMEIETLRPSNSLTKQITQIGCSSSLSKERNFFQVIEPKDLNHYLSNFQFAGNLLQFLHLQKNDSGQFEYRKEFEIVEEADEVPQCTTEYEALEELASFLSSFSSDCVLVSISKETIGLVIERMKHYGIDCGFLKGFCTWNSFLENTISSLGSSVEFDDWYSANVNEETPGSLHSEAVASMHKEAINKISQTYFSSSTSGECNVNLSTSILQQSSSTIVCLFAASSAVNNSIMESASSAVNDSIMESQSLPQFLELHNSFRPNLPTTIAMSGLDILEISSDEEESASQISLEAPQAMAMSLAICISDTEPDDETLSPPTLVVQPEAAKIYCQVCEREFAVLDGLHHHVWISGKHRRELIKVLSKPDRLSNRAPPPSDAGHYESSRSGIWSIYETILWSELKNGLSAMSSDIKIERFGEKTRNRIESFATIALNLSTRADLITNYIEKQLAKNTLLAKKQVPIRLLYLMGSLCLKSHVFRDLFEIRIVEHFIRAFKVSPRTDVKHFVDLWIEWENSNTFKTVTLNELDSKISNNPAWKKSLLKLANRPKAKTK